MACIRANPSAGPTRGKGWVGPAQPKMRAFKFAFWVARPGGRCWRGPMCTPGPCAIFLASIPHSGEWGAAQVQLGPSGPAHLPPGAASRPRAPGSGHVAPAGAQGRRCIVALASRCPTYRVLGCGGDVRPAASPATIAIRRRLCCERPWPARLANGQTGKQANR